jgi:hypothetical protein
MFYQLGNDLNPVLVTWRLEGSASVPGKTSKKEKPRIGREGAETQTIPGLTHQEVTRVCMGKGAHVNGFAGKINMFAICEMFCA